MITFDGQLAEFDFFMDEDTRSKRIGVLLMEKRLTPALTQALFRIRQNADIFHELQKLDLSVLKSLKNTQSVFFLDSFNTPAGYKFEQEIMVRNNLSRCYRLDSRVHDLIQLTDLLLGVTVFELKNKQTSSKPKLNLIRGFKSDREYYLAKKKDQAWDPIYIF